MTLSPSSAQIDSFESNHIRGCEFKVNIHKGNISHVLHVSCLPECVAKTIFKVQISIFINIHQVSGVEVSIPFLYDIPDDLTLGDRSVAYVAVKGCSVSDLRGK